MACSFLLIHGIGDQESFETLDAFARPFLEVYGNGSEVSKKHEITRLANWTESRLSLSAENSPGLNVYEYYWAHLCEGKISSDEVVRWVFRVAEGAEKFYAKQDAAGGNDELFKKDGEFKNYKYFAKVLSLGNIWSQPLYFVSRLPAFSWLAYLLRKLFRKPLENLLGDIVLYSSTDQKSEYFQIRNKILGGAVEKIKEFLKKDDCERLVILGHSLGSVIAYDTLARINREMNVDPGLREAAKKIQGLVTFGSPLDKIAFFFDQKIPKEQTMRSAIVSQLYGFKRVNVETEALASGIVQYFDNLKWLNFYACSDPVSGHLDVYKDVQNIEMNFDQEIGKSFDRGLKSHSQYWKSKEMYRRIVKEYLMPALKGE